MTLGEIVMDAQIIGLLVGINFVCSGLFFWVMRRWGLLRGDTGPMGDQGPPGPRGPRGEPGLSVGRQPPGFGEP
jgi:hypothetical protein